MVQWVPIHVFAYEILLKNFNEKNTSLVWSLNHPVVKKILRNDYFLMQRHLKKKSKWVGNVEKHKVRAPHLWLGMVELINRYRMGSNIPNEVTMGKDQVTSHP